MWRKLIKGLFGSDGFKTLINGVLIAAVSVWGYYQAYDSGFNAAKAEAEISRSQALNAQLLKLGEEIHAANQVSSALSGKLTEYQQLGEQTTDELQKILAKTAALRAACRFDADSLRQLERARQRAADAATRGVNGTLSNPADTGGQ